MSYTGAISAISARLVPFDVMAIYALYQTVD